MSQKVKLTYGKSMYGGWYAQNVYHDVALHCDTLKELRAEINESFAWCELGERFDNI